MRNIAAVNGKEFPLFLFERSPSVEEGAADREAAVDTKVAEISLLAMLRSSR